ncbi:MAG: diguanylate cyclase [Clostridiales bacterium]|nr:diguanylate cyclase [Clostridiales bacterium]
MKNTEKKEFDSEFYTDILGGLHSNIYVTDVETDEIVYMNDCMKEAFHLEGVEGKVCWEVLQVGMTKRCDFCKISQLKAQGENSSCIWKERNTVTGREYLNRDRLVKKEGRTYHIQESTDITEYLQISMDAAIDELTGMLNRKTGKKRLETALKELKKGEQITVALYDVDGLKWVNDTYGHLEGDRLLVFIADCIKSGLEEQDFAFRLSGDEFVIAFNGKSLPEAEQWMKESLASLKEKQRAAGLDYDVTFSYGFAPVFQSQNLTVSDVLSIADTQMYMRKRDYHIQKEKKLLGEKNKKAERRLPFQYNKDYLFDVLAESVDDYIFVGNLSTGRFMYSYKMMLDFGLPGQVIDNAAAFWGEKVHPDDVDLFLKSNQEIADGRAERHTIVYRAKNVKKQWVHLMCRGQMVRNEQGKPELFAGVIRNLDNKAANSNEELRLISDSSTDGIFKAAMTEGFPVLYANDGYYELHGYTRKQMTEELNNHADHLVYEGDKERVQREIQESIEKKDVRIVLEYRVRKRDGSIAWVHVNAGITHSQDGPLALIGMIMEITERRKLEERLRRMEQLFNVARKHTRLNMWELDLRNKRIIQTEESKEIHGMGNVVENVPESLIESGYIHPESVETYRRLYAELESGKETAEAEVYVRLKDREDGYWLEKIIYTVAQREAGKPIWAVGVSEDITAQREAEIRVFKEERLREILTEDMVLSFRVNMDKNSVEELWEQSSENEEMDFSGKGYEEVYKRILDTIANNDDRVRFQNNYTLEKIRERMKEGLDIPKFEFRYQQKNGRIIWLVLNMKVVPSPKMREKILFGYTKNIDFLKKNELSLKRKAEIDEVSGFYNASTAKLLIEDILEKSVEKKNDSMIMLLDVDEFKEINRKGGFLAGDQVLYELSSELNHNLPSSCVKARMSGDLFMIFCYEIPGKEELHRRMEKVRKAVCQKYRAGGYEFEVTVSAGISMRFSEGMSYEQMYHYAQHTLNMAKRKGGNQLLFYREVELMETGLDICFTVDAETYEIVDMNATGQIALGMSTIKDFGKKCYELLHNRTKPCEFCYKKIKAGGERVWGCFVPRLNKVMYVKESIKVKEGREFREIYLQEEEKEERTGNSSLEVVNLIEKFWKQTQRGEIQSFQSGVLLNCLGRIFKARYAALYEKNDSEKEWKFGGSWKISGVERYEENSSHVEILQKILQLKFPNNVLLIENERNAEYEMIRKFYGDRPVPVPLVLAGVYEKERMEMMVLLENTKVDREAIKALSLSIEFMLWARRIYKIQKNYEFALRHDESTGLLNFRGYVNYLHNANEDIHSAFGVVGVQMVELKNYNQHYGLQAGDTLLQFVAGVLGEVYGTEYSYRVSGAGFRVLCPDVAYENFLSRFKLLKEKVEGKYRDLCVFAKVWEQSCISVEKLENQVEERLHVARSAKRNKNMNESEQTVTEIRRDLQREIEMGNFRTFLQPKARTATGEICGAEALIRYHHKEKGTIPPGRFLPTIERAGVIRYIDLFVLEDVCRIIKEWMEKGWEPFPISLNYSRATILEPGILEETERIVSKMGIPRHLIEIEVTESISSIDSVGLKAISNKFREAGYKIALDDFGAEYSNMYVLYSLNLNDLKLDRRIISDIYHDSRARFVVEKVIEICRKLGIVCVAEGVETEEHLGVLKEMGCDVIQGYYLNKPLAEEEFEMQYIKMR